jgi:hypothetical protein
VLLSSAPPTARGRLDAALHAAAVGGVQWTFLVSGVVGVLVGLLVLALIRPAAAPAEAGPVTDPAAEPALS